MASKAKAIAADDVSRRDFLKKAAIGLAAAAGLSAAMQQKAFGTASVPPIELPEDSIFSPRADQRSKVVGK